MRVLLSENARRDLYKLSPDISVRVLDKIERFATTFDNQKPISLGGNLEGNFKLRVGDWRVMYAVDYVQQLIIIIAVDHRSKIYRRDL